MEEKVKKIRLLLGITLSEMGGAQKVVYDLITSLPQTKYSLTLVTYPGGELLQWVEQFNQGRKEKIAIVVIPSLRREISPRMDVKSLFHLYRIMKQGQFDIAHFHSSKMGILGRWAAWMARVPKILFTVHGWGVNEYQPKMLQRTLSLVEKITGKLSDKIICVSKEHYDIGVQKGWISPLRAAIIYNGISLPPNNNGKLKSELDIKEEIPVIGTIMRLRTPKDPLFTIEVFHEVKKQGGAEKLVIIGEGPLRIECETLIEKYSLTEDVFLLGTRMDARELLNDFDVFTLFTKWEGLPLVIMEAMFAGKPIISLKVGGIAELILHGERGYLLESLDVQQAVERIKEVLENEDLRKSVGKKAQIMAYKHFTKDRMIQEYRKIYEEDGAHQE